MAVIVVLPAPVAVNVSPRAPDVATTEVLLER